MEIGGYFGLELSRCSNDIHNGALKLKSGRSSFNLILTILKPSQVYLPYYTCDSIIQPIIDRKVPYKFLEIDENFEFKALPEVRSGEIILAINYWGIKEIYIKKLISIYNEQLVVDNSQGYFWRATDCWSFNSARKFFGVPDGSAVYVPKRYKNQYTSIISNLPRNGSYTLKHLFERYEANTSVGYKFYQKNECLIDDKLERISLISELLLSRLDYTNIAQKRKENFLFYQRQLGRKNQLKINYLDSESVPNYYPFLPFGVVKKERFWENKIFIPQLWYECIDRESIDFVLEKDYSKRLLPLPMDHRYRPKDLNRVIELINE